MLTTFVFLLCRQLPLGEVYVAAGRARPPRVGTGLYWSRAVLAATGDWCDVFGRSLDGAGRRLPFHFFKCASRTADSDIAHIGDIAPVRSRQSVATDQVKAFIDEVIREDCFVCGNSLGGFVAASFAALYPKKVLGVSCVTCRASQTCF
jgi:pimeloyl-ACP methyl ester carboxylesterase